MVVSMTGACSACESGKYAAGSSQSTCRPWRSCDAVSTQQALAGSPTADITRRRNLHLYRLCPLVRTAETSILHLIAGHHCVALATSSNTLLLHRAGGRGGPPLSELCARLTVAAVAAR